MGDEIDSNHWELLQHLGNSRIRARRPCQGTYTPKPEGQQKHSRKVVAQDECEPRCGMSECAPSECERFLQDW
eukprot:5137536-Alexandrium_andersonii.AAC.1